MTTYPMLQPLRRLVRLRAVALMAFTSLLLTSCGLLVNQDDAKPRARLTAEQLAWLTPMRAPETTWRFSNNTGQVATLKWQSVSEREVKLYKQGSTKSKDEFYRQELTCSFSNDVEAITAVGLTFKAEISIGNMHEPLVSQLHVGMSTFPLPVTALNQGQSLPASGQVVLLPQLNVGGQTYLNVLEITPYDWTQPLHPEAVVRLYYSKEHGLLRFRQHNGKVWNRQP